LRLLVEDDAAEDGQAGNSAMDVDIPAGQDSKMSRPLSEVRSETNVKPTQDDPPIRNIIHTPDGTIIVETLDTPTLRRQKSTYRRIERLRLAAEAEAAAAAVAGPSRLSESSSLTDLEDEEDGEKRAKSGVHAPPPPPIDPAVVVLAEGETLEGGTLGAYHKPCHLQSVG
jgi:hypothetical protein